MTICRACVGEVLREFGSESTLADVWAFIDSQMAASSTERAIVLVDDAGRTLGELWDSSLYFAHWETPERLASYLWLMGFDQDEEITSFSGS